MQALIPGKNYTRGQWRSERLNMDEEELFDHLTLELSDLLDFIRINKQPQGDVIKTSFIQIQSAFRKYVNYLTFIQLSLTLPYTYVLLSRFWRGSGDNLCSSEKP